MDLKPGLYEQLINQLIASRLQQLPDDRFHIERTHIDKSEAALYLTNYLSSVIRFALSEVKKEDQPLRQIEIANKIIQLLAEEFGNLTLTDNLVDMKGELLEAIIHKLDNPYPDISARVREIMPYTRLSQSELFTGNHSGVSLESELRKEIESSDEICWIVSFIRFSGIRIFKQVLESFTQTPHLEGKPKLRVITTTYMGATEEKAVQFLANLPNTEVRISYNSEHERLHAKAYLFLRESGFHTGYIGSSNLSRSALTNGLEWNLKITTQEITHIIQKFQKTFDTYWNDAEFEIYKPNQDEGRLRKAINRQQRDQAETITTFFDLKPYTFQSEILEKLDAERRIHQRNRNLVVAATGTGKTVISAFDFKRFYQENPGANLLFIAHRKEILEQARDTFRHVLRDSNFGELWVDGYEPSQYTHLFASVQTLNRRMNELDRLNATYFDYIVVDEVHHIAASSYRPILKRFEPAILLGLTATPERHDGANIFEDFDGRIAAEIRLPEAINRKLLSPFHYFGISDSVDLNNVSWSNGRYDVNELTNLYTESDRRVGEILKNCDTYLTDVRSVKALGFCVTKDHARFMAQKFKDVGLKADMLTSDSSGVHRDTVKRRLLNGEINYLFVVDIFNEGVDIPEIDTVLFLRPTESLTVFLQQLGRGLRLSNDKECLTVLDFVGNARAEYDFNFKFRALVGKTRTPIHKEIENDFPHLPLGCSIILEKRAKEIVLENIRQATQLHRPAMVQKIRNFKNQADLSLSLDHFLHFYSFELQDVYKFKRGSKRIGWSNLCAEAGEIEEYVSDNEHEMARFISQRLLSTTSLSWLYFLNGLSMSEWSLSNLKQNYAGTKKVPENKKNRSTPFSALATFSTVEIDQLGLMLHYDLWQECGADSDFETLEQSLQAIGKHPILAQELAEVVNLLIERTNLLEKHVKLDIPMPLCVHGRYTRDQILAAMQLHTWQKRSSNREGVAENKELNVEALFVTLTKSEKDYSPSTMYEDYALNETLFHWQSQNDTFPQSKKGYSYIHHQKQGKTILLFVREKNEDEYGTTMGYVFLGEVLFKSYYGEKPMNIEWKLKEPIPSYLLTESRKLAVG